MQSYHDQIIVTGSSDGYLSLWYGSSLKPFQRIQAHSESISIILWDNIKGYLTTCGYDKQLSVWDMSTGTKLYNIRLRSNQIIVACIYNMSRGGEYVIGARGCIYIYNICNNNK